MRIILFAVFYIISLNGIYAQCEVDAGVNKNYCDGDIWLLNGTIISGEVDRISWEICLDNLPFIVKTSDVVSDTSALTTSMLDLAQKTLKFYLIGHTSNDSTCIDSVEHNFRRFIYSPTDKIINKEARDTVQLYKYIDSQWGIEKYAWTPNFMISDTTIEQPYAWNDTTTFYDLMVTDSIGCTAFESYFAVYVIMNSVSNYDQSVHIKLFPNPAIEEINIVSDERIIETYLYNMNGQLFKISNNDKIDIRSLPKGEYIAISKMEDGKLTGLPFLKM